MRSVWLGLVCSVRCIGRLSVWNSERFCGLESAVGKLRENDRGARQGGGAARSGGGGYPLSGVLLCTYPERLRLLPCWYDIVAGVKGDID